MKLRTDFVTNSSDANFILELRLVDRDGKEASGEFWVDPTDPDGVDTPRGHFYADYVNLDLREVKDEIASVISQRQDVLELCNLLCNSAVVEGVGDEDDEDDVGGGETDSNTRSLSEVFPDGIQKLKDACLDEGISAASISYVVADNEVKGWGDSAKWLPYDNDVLMKYRRRYAAADDDEKEAVLQELVEFVQSEPVLEVHDNEGVCEGEQRVVWVRPQTLRASMEKYLNEEWEEGHPTQWEGWDGTWTIEYVYNAATRAVETKEALLIPNDEP